MYENIFPFFIHVSRLLLIIIIDKAMVDRLTSHLKLTINL